MILLKIWSMPLTWYSPHPPWPIIWRVCLLMVFHIFCMFHSCDIFFQILHLFIWSRSSILCSSPDTQYYPCEVFPSSLIEILSFSIPSSFQLLFSSAFLFFVCFIQFLNSELSSSFHSAVYIHYFEHHSDIYCYLGVQWYICSYCL